MAEKERMADHVMNDIWVPAMQFRNQIEREEPLYRELGGFLAQKANGTRERANKKRQALDDAIVQLQAFEQQAIVVVRKHSWVYADEDRYPDDASLKARRRKSYTEYARAMTENIMRLKKAIADEVSYMRLNPHIEG